MSYPTLPKRDPKRRALLTRAFAGGLLVALLSLANFAYRLADEPHFMDESAYLSQTYFARLLLKGNVNDSAWLEYPAIDLPPLAKYTIGMMLMLADEPLLGKEAARTWYRTRDYRPETPAMLAVGRWSSVLFGVIGCVSIYAIGSLATGRMSVGLIAAALLAENPLFRLHARRAMADAPVEGLMLAGLAVGLLFWNNTCKRDGTLIHRLSTALFSGVLAGLAVLAKLNGGLALIVLTSWALVGFVSQGARRQVGYELLAGLAIAAAAALGAFSVLNPTLYAHPRGNLPRAIAQMNDKSYLQRIQALIDHRESVSRLSLSRFPEALPTLADKAKAFVVQGFGRFGALGPAHTQSWIRYEWKQDWGVLVWLPLVLAGLAWGVFEGRRQVRSGVPPGGWCLVAQALPTWFVVGSFLPLAWDRYFLSIQASSALMAAGVLDALVRRLARAGRTTT